jgi:cyclophilin family peptidyl-prolyl cis-trans isomerase/HEAT repeat protein
MTRSLRLLALLLLPLPPALAAQQQAVVEQLANLLAAEDARDFRAELLRGALVAPDSLVRRTAAMSAGRIGDLRATPLVLPLLGDSDSTVRVAAAFALGLLRDTAAARPLMDRLTGLPALDATSAAESVTALAKIGGAAVGDFFSGILTGRVALSVPDREPVVHATLLDFWRLGTDAPAQALLPFADDTSLSRRWRAAFSLGRLRAPAAGERLTVLLRDREVVVRSIAARALTRGYAEAAGLAPGTVAELLARSVSDQSAQVRINAVRSLGGYRDTALVAFVAPLLGDPVPNVQVEAVTTLGLLGGPEAARLLAGLATARGLFAVRREALIGLARADSSAFAAAAGSWRSSGDWRERAAAAEGIAVSGPGAAPWFLGDKDPRVVAAGLQAWAGEVQGPDSALVAAARPLLARADAAVRSVAADLVGRAAAPTDLPALVQAYRLSARDSFPEAALSALGAIAAIRQAGAEAQSRVDREFLATTARPANYLLRRWAEDNWSEAAARWGPAYPLETGRAAQDYRDLVQRFVVGADSIARPTVRIETEQRGPVEIELLGPDAPLTVANFLRLVNRRFFDGNRWHRVVPNFVVQDGDPRGDGFGGPGGAIRDEINRQRYDGPMLGMALSGPDTGSSQWFINLSPQPHLDGTYTVFGRVIGGQAALIRITQGDVIRTVRQ